MGGCGPDYGAGFLSCRGKTCAFFLHALTIVLRVRTVSPGGAGRTPSYAGTPDFGEVPADRTSTQEKARPPINEERAGVTGQDFRSPPRARMNLPPGFRGVKIPHAR